jgi:hypothetical protein
LSVPSGTPFGDQSDAVPQSPLVPSTQVNVGIDMIFLPSKLYFYRLLRVIAEQYETFPSAPVYFADP